MFKICFFLYFTLLLSQTMAGRDELRAVIEGNGQFTKRLYEVLAKEPGNVFFSPLSAHAVLAMAFQGSDGITRDAFTSTLAVTDSQAAKGYQDIIGHLNNISGIQLLMANKIYVKDGYALKATFKDVTQKQFQSEVQSINFANSANAASTINQWVEQKTQNKIKNLIDPSSLDGLTRLVLVNAIYFKGNWASKFPKENTKTEKFYLNDRDSIDVQMMNNKDKYFYKEDQTLDAKVLELPYANPDISLIVILPNTRNGIVELEKKLATTDLTKISEGMFKPEVNVKLPKFKIETTIELNEPLKKLGLGNIFDNSANFSKILESSEPLKVSKVIQKAFIEVNEEGTEAAAATGMNIRMKRSIDEPRIFVADSPFVILLAHKTEVLLNKNVIFCGKITEPQREHQQHDEF